MAVQIDIPGVGLVTAENAASEATLEELLEVFKRYTGDEGGRKPKFDDFKKGLGGAKTSSDKFAISARMAGRGLLDLANSSTRLINEFANVGNSISSATQTLSYIPVVGNTLANVFTAVARNAEQLGNSFINATATGATFGGSVLDMARSASEAGMTLDDFAGLMQRNGEALLGFGETTADGARRFSRLSRTLLNTNDGLYNLGLGTQQINEGLLNYSRLLRIQGIQQGLSDRQLLSGTQDYLKTLDELAKVTGERRDSLAEEQAQIASSAQFQAALQGTSADVRQSFNDLITQMPNNEMKELAKDVLATGTVSQEQNQLLASQFPNVVSALQESRKNIQSNTVLTTRDRQRIDNILIREGQRVAQSISGIAGANQALFPVMQTATAAQRRQIGAIIAAEQAQQSAAEGGDNFNQVLQQSQQEVARMGNFFTVALAQSGLLPLAIDSVVILGNIVSGLVLPAFRLVGTVITDFVVPSLRFIGGVIDDYLFPILTGVAGAFIALKGAAAAQAIATGIQTGVTATATAATGAFAALMAALSAPVLAVIAGAVAVGAIFKILYDKGWSLGDMWEGLKDTATLLGLALKNAAGLVAGQLQKYLVLPFQAITSKITSFFEIMFINLAGAIDRLKTALNPFADEEAFASRQQLREQQLEELKNAEAAAKIARQQEVQRIDENKQLREQEYQNALEDVQERRKARAEERHDRARARSEEPGLLSGLLGNLTGGGSFTRDLENLRTRELDAREEIVDDNEDFSYSNPIQSLVRTAEQAGTADEFRARTGGQPVDRTAPMPSPELAQTGGPETDTPGAPEEARGGGGAGRRARREAQGTGTRPQGQETQTDPIQQLNTNITELVRLMRVNNDLTRREISVTEGLSGDLYKAIG